ncbi:MAG TPA: anthranilate synthase component I [Vicinamibacteria bacterium]|nr:anthranilate synthase component I [Vicinamibacteria bacterium]
MKWLGFEEYQRLSEAGGLVPVYREIPGDLLTPVSAFLALAGQAERAFLLESVVGGERIARYSFLGRHPVSTLEARGRGLVERRDGEEREVPGDLLGALRARVGRCQAEVPGLPRFTGGAVGYLTYDAVRLFERVPERHPGEEPIASFSFYRSLVAFDHVQQRLVLIADAEPSSRRAFEEAQAVLDGLEADLRAYRQASTPRRPEAGRAETPDDSPLGDGDAFRAAVAQAKEYIAAGDIFQVVLSRGRTLASGCDPFTVYRALRMVNPSPYMYFLKDGETAVAGASPEMLVRVENRRVETRPIAGTRRRGTSDEEDARSGEELLADAKERAEHVMLVDLGRNDLGRVCRFRSVEVPEFMGLERYSHVIHIVSSVTGELREGQDALDALVAAFPAGTLSGAPKIRAMEIIDALEPGRRGLYGGALGYLDLRGNLDFCIAIRTLVFRDGQATIQAGAGIVADSDPEAEQRETEDKAGAMLAALRLAEGL